MEIISCIKVWSLFLAAKFLFKLNYIYNTTAYQQQNVEPTRLSYRPNKCLGLLTLQKWRYKYAISHAITMIVSDGLLKSASVLVLFIQWFYQLFALLALSYIHYAVLFMSQRYRAISPRNMLTTNMAILAIALLLTSKFFLRVSFWKTKIVYTQQRCIFHILFLFSLILPLIKF